MLNDSLAKNSIASYRTELIYFGQLIFAHKRFPCPQCVTHIPISATKGLKAEFTSFI